MFSARGAELVRFECPACYERFEVPFSKRYSTLTCPRCAGLVQFAKHQLFWLNLKRVWWPAFWTSCCLFAESVRAKRAARARRRKQDEEAAQSQVQAARAILLAGRQQAEEAAHRHEMAIQMARQRQIEAQAHYEAVIAGRTFDAAILADEFKNDWVALQEACLNGLHIIQGFKGASPVAGIGSYLLGAPPWMAALIGLGTYLASGTAGEGYVEGKALERHVKWARILANLSEDQQWQFARTLQQRSPLVYSSMMSRMLPPGG